LIQPKEPVEIPSTSDAEDDNTHLSSTEHDEDDDEGNREQVYEEKVLTHTCNPSIDLPTAKRPESAMPEVSQDKHYSVNVNLKPLFGSEEGMIRVVICPKLT
jgi:hypothetical protein